MVRCGCGGTVMPPFEWTAVCDEPGCRQAAAAMDPQIKLFGQTISVSPSHTGAGADAEFLNPSSAYTAPPSSQDGGDSVQQRGAESKGASESLVRALSSSSRDEDLLQLHVKSRECGVAPASGVPHLCDEQSEGIVTDERDSQSVGSDGSKSKEQKVEKVVPCPRCSSEDTKFCYYNNYNVNQPRHFCKNCQRYWTAGGTLRNVPVGAGRRKNKASGGVHRENSEASSFQMELGEFSCGVGSPKVKVSHPKRVAGQGSPVRSPGSSGQESGISMSSPPYSLYQNGRQSLQSFISVGHGFNTSGTEANRMGSSDPASTMRGGERLAQFFPGNGGGFDKDCHRRLSLQSKQMQDAGAHNEYSDTGVSGWVGNFGGRQQPVREWQPHGYLADWNDGEHHLSAVSQPFPSGSAGINSAGAPPAWASTPWASSHPTWTGNNPHQSLHGKRQNEAVEDCYSAKRMRIEVETKREWPVRTNPESGILKQLLQQPKLEHLGAAYEPKDSFMSRLFNNTTGPWPVPFPVAI